MFKCIVVLMLMFIENVNSMLLCLSSWACYYLLVLVLVMNLIVTMICILVIIWHTCIIKVLCSTMMIWAQADIARLMMSLLSVVYYIVGQMVIIHASIHTHVTHLLEICVHACVVGNLNVCVWKCMYVYVFNICMYIHLYLCICTCIHRARAGCTCKQSPWLHTRTPACEHGC